MPREPKTYLWDAHEAAEAIERFTSGKDLTSFLDDELLRSAVERQFEIIGEALRQLAMSWPDVAAQVPDHRRIIAFRNILIHGYASIDHETVWHVVQDDLPKLREVLRSLLDAGEGGEAAS
jgi:uncharacterized protein with HEPN domain